MAIEIQNSTGAHIFVKAMYPDGLREVKPSAVKGDVLYLDLGDLRRAWDEHLEKYGQGAEPLIVLTIVKDGKIAVQGVSLKWKTPYQKVKVVPEYRPLKASEVSAKDSPYGNIEPMDSYWEVLEDWEERTIPVVVAEVINADESAGQITYYYATNKRVGFGVYLFVSSEWSRVGTYYTYNANGGKHIYMDIDEGQDAYVWMEFVYRYEKWKIHIDGQNFYEEYVFVKSFDPSSLTGSNYKDPDVAPAPINSWEFEGRFHQEGIDNYYSLSSSNFGSDSFALDVLDFISAISGTISQEAVNAAANMDLFIDVNYEYGGTEAFVFSISLHGYPGTYHRVWKGEARTNVNNMNTVPVIGVYVAPG